MSARKTLKFPARFWVGASLIVALTLGGGVGIAATLGRSGSKEDWSRWSDVGQSFGVLSSVVAVLTLAAVVVTTRIQNRELQRNSAVGLGHLHAEILKMSIEDEELAEVWPAFHPNLSASRNRQYLYANIIYQFHLTSLKLKNASDEEVVGSMRYLFTSPIMRGYWAAAQHIRTSLEPGSAEFAFAATLDDICRDYDAAVATANRGAGPTHTSDIRAPEEALRVVE
jgi:hypothetical protein